MGYRAVLFDFDGTLVDSLEDIADAMNEVLTRSGYPTHPIDAYRYFVGDGMEMLVRRALPEGHSDEVAVGTVLDAMRVEYAKHSTRKTRPYAGIPDLLDRLTARGLPFAILSNKPHEATLAMVSLLLGAWRFAAILGARAGVPKKPDPVGALEIAAKVNVPPDAWLYVGDTGTDMETARAAGMVAVGALWGFRTAEELRQAGAAMVIEHPLELIPDLSK